MRKRIWLWVFLFVTGQAAGCIPGLPDSAWQAAVNAVCSSPLVPGQDMCQGVRFIGFAELDETELFPALKRTHEYCVVLDYVDFTGETGTAWVQVSGPDEGGDYRADGGPLFEEPCAK